MNLDRAVARERFIRGRLAHLATVRPGGQPHVVPTTFAVRADIVVCSVDAKPKSSTNLQRLRNIASDPRVSVLVDFYDDADWSGLWWVRADGIAAVLSDKDPMQDKAIGWLAEKYPQYVGAVPSGPVVRIAVSRWSGWAYA